MPNQILNLQHKPATKKVDLKLYEMLLYFIIVLRMQDDHPGPSTYQMPAACTSQQTTGLEPVPLTSGTMSKK